MNGKTSTKPGEQSAGKQQQAADEALAGDSSDGGDQLRAELTEAKDRALRASAELENYRKRMQREMDDALRYANMPLVRDLLPALDNLQRAADAAGQTAAGQANDAPGLLSGVNMVVAQFGDVLTKHHCRRIAALGQPFDPNIHEAIAQQPSDEYPPGTVILEASTGYQLHDRVVRPTQVIVSGERPAS